MTNHLEEKIYCINPDCHHHRQGIPDFSLEEFNMTSSEDTCSSCQTPILIMDKYLLVLPLYGLDIRANSEVWQLYDTTESDEYPQVLKILVLPENSTPTLVSRANRLFTREYKVLAYLNELYPRLGIPKVNKDFIIDLSSKRWQCFLMDKVRGINLITYVEKHGKINNNLALEWLQQLLEILDKIHNKELIHQDIKPSNIMLTEDNQQLTLIDFGTIIAEDATTTIAAGTFGYMAPEQLERRPCKQSDFYALGYTFIYLLTEISPNTLKEQNSNWRNSAPDISPLLANLIDALIAPNPNNRPKNVQEIQNLLNGTTSNTATTTVTNSSNSNVNSKLKYLSIIGISFTIAGLIGIFRSLGFLEFLELKTYDSFLQMPPSEKIDPQLLLITITQEDVNNQPSQERGAASLSDRSFEQLLAKLEKSPAVAIGLDIYRDNPVRKEYPKLAKKMQESNRLFGICMYGDEGTPPPIELTGEKHGFNNILLDSDNILRRGLLAVESPQPCQNFYAFSLQLVKHYLAKTRPDLKFDPKNENSHIQIGSTTFKPLEPQTGGYHHLENRGHQILINYRNNPQIAEKVTLSEFLTKYPPEKVGKRIVLIGTTAASFNDDRWQIPLGTVSGLEIQAYLVSQLLSTVLENRPLISVLPVQGEFVFIWLFATLGGAIALCLHSRRDKILITLPIILLLLGLGWIPLRWWGLWLPIFPSFVALVVTGSIMIPCSDQLERKFNSYGRS